MIFNHKYFLKLLYFFSIITLISPAPFEVPCINNDLFCLEKCHERYGSYRYLEGEKQPIIGDCDSKDHICYCYLICKGEFTILN